MASSAGTASLSPLIVLQQQPTNFPRMYDSLEELWLELLYCYIFRSQNIIESGVSVGKDNDVAHLPQKKKNNTAMQQPCRTQTVLRKGEIAPELTPA
ncbi:hypothetical protein GX48_01529 [Paracoccidioides brasiliensis]|nr:hypothetical protein GX48_01529 [Paracoccidioides brasiliensis]